MKGAFECGLIMMVGIFFLVLGINFTRIPLAYHQARSYQEIIVTQIEHYHRYDDFVISIIEQSQKVCSACHYLVETTDFNRYQVTVLFPIKIPILNFEVNGKVLTLTQPLY